MHCYNNLTVLFCHIFYCVYDCFTVRKLRGSVDEEGGRYSSFSDDSADVILKQGEPQQVC